MKFLHTADWHLGKLVHGVYMTEDQASVLAHFIQIAEEENPDAIVIAGDLYDRSVPPAEAVNLLDRTLYTLNVQMGIPVIAISGNHDSADRLAFGSAWYRQSGMHMTGKWTPELDPVTIKGVTFHSVPYAEPALIRSVLDDETIMTHHDASKKIIEQISESIKPDTAHVFVGHSFVAGGQTSDSERTLSVGGAGTVGKDLFSPFVYTALGHLHSPDAIKDEKVHYSGSLLKYSFSEANQRKIVKSVTIENGQATVKEIPLKPKRDMRIIEGHLADLLSESFYQHQKTDDYLKVVLLDEGSLIDPMNRLRSIYPNVLHLERKTVQRDKKMQDGLKPGLSADVSDVALFKKFYQHVTTAEWTDLIEKEAERQFNATGRDQDQ
ncbi:exonuclease SbcCD subunit D [Jeotgalibacillus sp. R-1-5s-1]|uniref:exonuclease SbcCD subunit D n=1 Tax=Jeotgalibacillus sp. R-1-5s-1 TaxID=2555897 RepID=UPI001069AD96|nr:exonuclease SbcCD subunit D [Jeotgalibacillus sp. R-1-5s-1]TFE03388.1 exonuclease SbcCD subunit D [Jeotgalibacillus sp. R-1-5s-1]